MINERQHPLTITPGTSPFVGSMKSNDSERRTGNNVNIADVAAAPFG